MFLEYLCFILICYLSVIQGGCDANDVDEAEKRAEEAERLHEMCLEETELHKNQIKELNEKLSQTMKDHEEEKETLNKEIEDLTEQLTQTMKDHEEEKETLNKEIEDLTEQLTQTMKDHEEEKETLNNEIEELKEKIKDYEQNIIFELDFNNIEGYNKLNDLGKITIANTIEYDSIESAVKVSRTSNNKEFENGTFCLLAFGNEDILESQKQLESGNYQLTASVKTNNWTSPLNLAEVFVKHFNGEENWYDLFVDGLYYQSEKLHTLSSEKYHEIVINFSTPGNGPKANNIQIGFGIEGTQFNTNDYLLVKNFKLVKTDQPCEPPPASGIVFSGSFGGAIIDENTYTVPSGAKSWAGFANEDTTWYPFSFPNGGQITFTGSASVDTNIYFRFEKNPYPDIEPSFSVPPEAHVGAASIMINDLGDYSVDIPEQGTNTFSSFLLYVMEQDQPVTLTNVAVTVYSQPIDSSKWHHQTLLPNNDSWWNNEIQHYTNRIENSYRLNSKLHIVAIKENFTDQGQTKTYTSARLNSKFAFLYGTVEIRAKLPDSPGTWPAFWTLGKNINEPGAFWETQGYGTISWPACGEIDIMEHWGSNKNFVKSSVHSPSSNGNTVNSNGKSINDVTEYHVYKMIWDEQKISFFVDDASDPHYVYNPKEKNENTWPFYKKQYLLLNLAVLPTSDFLQEEIVIDYVKVYQSGNVIWEDNFDP